MKKIIGTFAITVLLLFIAVFVFAESKLTLPFEIDWNMFLEDVKEKYGEPTKEIEHPYAFEFRYKGLHYAEENVEVVFNFNQHKELVYIDWFFDSREYRDEAKYREDFKKINDQLVKDYNVQSNIGERKFDPYYVIHEGEKKLIFAPFSTLIVGKWFPEMWITHEMNISDDYIVNHWIEFKLN